MLGLVVAEAGNQVLKPFRLVDGHVGDERHLVALFRGVPIAGRGGGSVFRGSGRGGSLRRLLAAAGGKRRRDKNQRHCESKDLYRLFHFPFSFELIY